MDESAQKKIQELKSKNHEHIRTKMIFKPKTNS
jgi:hypothetical protein